ncbi:hypothetical protein NBRC116494_27730 [Aurantivibrio plasticivorans]
MTSFAKNILFYLLIVSFVLSGLLLATGLQFSAVFEAATEAYLGEQSPILGSKFLDFLFTPASSSIAALATAGCAVFSFYSNKRRNWAIGLFLASLIVLGLLAYIAYLYLVTTKLI